MPLIRAWSSRNLIVNRKDGRNARPFNKTPVKKKIRSTSLTSSQFPAMQSLCHPQRKSRLVIFNLYKLV